jgi:nucleolar protein 4
MAVLMYQVVKRRVEKVTTDREGVRVEKGKKRKAIEAEDSEDEGAGEKASAKKPRGGNGKGDRKGGKRDRDGAERGAGGKRPRRDQDGEGTQSAIKPSEREKKGLEKLGGQLGSLIGRKRKMRKGGK